MMCKKTTIFTIPTNTIGKLIGTSLFAEIDKFRYFVFFHNTKGLNLEDYAKEFNQTVAS